MGKLIFDIAESDFNKKSSPSYQLSILIGMDSLIYLVSNEQQKVLLLRDYKLGSQEQLNLSQTVQSDPLLQLLYRKVKIAFCSTTFAIIPERLYNDSEKQAFLNGVTRLPDNQMIAADLLHNLNLRMVYGVEQKKYDLVKNQFPTANIFHEASPLILATKKNIAPNSEHRLLVSIKNRRLSICLFNRQNLLFYNVFNFENAKDALYYLLLIFEQFKLKPEETPVHLAGQILENSELYELFFRYIRHLQFVEAPAHYSFGKRFGNTSTHLYFDLFSLHLCR